MPHVKTLLAERGTTFSNFFVTNSLCCPSRSSILRGQYVHNHEALGNTTLLGGFEEFYALGHEDSTIANWLRAAGYRTSLIGKYLNNYPDTTAQNHVPLGWDHWVSPVYNTGYQGYLYVLSENGTLVPYGTEPRDYFNDVVSLMANVFIKEAARHRQPFFLYLATYAPHPPATPAPRYSTLFLNVTAPRTPSFNEVDALYRRRLRFLQAVDEMVASLIGTLASIGQLDNTHIFFTSDNGFHLGQHRMREGEKNHYEEDIHVPLIVRGPGVPARHAVDHLAVEIDLAPTLAGLGGAAVPHFADGRSLVPLLHRRLSVSQENSRQCLL